MAGLREQKKAETREAIARAALQLTAERGLDGVTVDDIAEAAHVARRTFRNYFPNKESAILHAVEAFVQDYADLVVTTDGAGTLLECLEAAAIALVRSPHAVDRVLTVRRLKREHAALRIRWAGAGYELSLAPIAAAVAARTRTDPGIDVYPSVVTRAAWGVLVSALDMQSGSDDLDRLVTRIGIGFAALRDGMSTPCRG